MTILEKWEITAEELSDIIHKNPSLRGMIFGYVAEHKLHAILEAIPGVTELGKDDDHDRKQKGDRVFSYHGQKIRVEVKSLQTNSIKTLEDESMVASYQCDASDRRIITLPNGEQVNTTCLQVGEFDIVAVNCFGFRNYWEFGFALNSDLPRSRFRGYTEDQQKYLLSSLMPITWPIQAPYTQDVESLLRTIIERRDCSGS